MKLKKIIPAILTVIFLFSCSGGAKMEYSKAKEVCENCMKAIDKGDFKTVVSEYYSTELGTSGSGEDVETKFKKLKEICGDLQSYTLKDSSMTAEIGEESQVILTYEVKHTRVTTTEKFVVLEQAGKYKIASHEVNN